MTLETLVVHPDYEIPGYLFENGLALSVDQYAGNSDRIIGFKDIERNRIETLDVFGMVTYAPQVTALTHNLWLNWLNKGRRFTEKETESLRELAEIRLQNSETKKLSLRHAVAAPWLKQSQGDSLNSLDTVDKVMDAITRQYTYYADTMAWDKDGIRDQVEVCLNLQEFTDPQSTFSFNYKEEGQNAPVFDNGSPPHRRLRRNKRRRPNYHSTMRVRGQSSRNGNTGNM